MRSLMLESFGNNIGAIIAVIVVVVILALGAVLYFAVFHKKNVEKIKANKEKRDAEKAEKASRDAKNKAYDEEVFAKMNAKKDDEADEKTSQNVMNVVQKQERTMVDTSKIENNARQGDDKGRDSVVSVLQGKQFSGKVEVEKKEPTQNEDRASGVLNVLGVKTDKKEDE